MSMFTNGAPVADEGDRSPRPRPYRAGGEQGNIAGRKTRLLNTGGVGHLPGSPKRNAHVYEAPQKSGRVPGSDELEYAPQARPHPREIPVSSQSTHAGNVVRYLDGHSEIHRERPALVGMLADPNLSHLHGDIRDEIAYRDALHTHRYW